jgi:hypothetical protein
VTKHVLTPVEDRFWSKVNKDGPIHPLLGTACWVWTRARTGFGYGKIGRGLRERRTIDAHRLSWEIHHGPVPPGLHVLHKCDNPPCVRPEHLFTGTRSDNMSDAESKGRLKHPGQSMKTHCLRGHPFSGENLRLTKAGYRRCWTCDRARRHAA